MNEQPIEKKDLHKDGHVDVHSIFYTIQGEGPFSGYPAVFIRLAGCNLQCPGCDTDYTGSRATLGPLSVLDLVKEQLGPTDLVVITGGEPFRQNITPLVETLIEEGLQVQIETNGTLYQPGFPYSDVTIVCSPKTARIARDLEKHIDAFKYVLDAKQQCPQDGLPLSVLNHAVHEKVARPGPGYGGLVYLQPMDSQSEENVQHLKAVVTACMEHGYILCLQTHKLIGVD